MKLFALSCLMSDHKNANMASVIGYRFAPCPNSAIGNFIEQAFKDYPGMELSSLNSIEVPAEKIHKYISQIPKPQEDSE